jgi:hypothetical protein
MAVLMAVRCVVLCVSVRRPAEMDIRLSFDV